MTLKLGSIVLTNFYYLMSVSKKTGTKLSSNTLLRFVPVFLKQTLCTYYVLVYNKNNNSNSNSNMAAWIHVAFWAFLEYLAQLLKTWPVKNSNPKKRIVLCRWQWHQHSMIHSPGIPNLINYTWRSSRYFIGK